MSDSAWDFRIRVDFVASRVLAIVVPALLVLWGANQVMSGKARDAERQLENAGQLLNGEVLKIPVTEAIDSYMQRDPNLVLLGNSFANTNVQIDDLGRYLGMGSRAVRLSIPNTIGTHWYALLKHRVFRPEYESPDVVLIVSDLQSALLTEPLSEGSYQNLLSLIDGDDPVIASRVQRNTNFLLETVLENRTRIRNNAVMSVRDGAARRVLDVPKKKVRRVTNEAMDRVFHFSRTDLTLYTSALPVTVGEETQGIEVSQLPRAADSFLPDIARLCHEHGARLVVVRNKESPLMPTGKGDLVPPERVAEVRTAIAEWGGVLIEADPIPMIAAHYDNLDHMSKEGSRRFTLALAEALTDLGIAEDRERYVRPEPPARIDAPDAEPPDALAGIRRSWKALPAGSKATWAWDAPWPGADATFRVRAVFEPLDDGAGPPVLRVGDREAGVLELSSGRWIAQLTRDAPVGPWSLEIDASRGAVMLEGLEVGTGSTPLYLSGYRPDVRGHRLELLGRFEVIEGHVYRDVVRPTFLTEPPELPRPGRNVRRAPGTSAAIEVSKLAPLSDMHSIKITPLRARCSPVRLSEDGVPLPYPNVGCKEVRSLGRGRMCHTDKKLYFSATDTTHPIWNGRSYLPFLDPERRCDGGFWMYPGDVATVRVPPDRLRELRDGVDTLEVDIGIAEVTEPPFGMEIRVLVNGAPHSTHPLSIMDLEGPHRIRLDPPLTPTDTVELQFDNRAGEVWAIVNRAALLPPPLVWEAFAPPTPQAP